MGDLNIHLLDSVVVEFASRGDLSTVKELFDQYDVDEMGRGRALITSTRAGHLDIMQFLLSSSPDIDRDIETLKYELKCNKNDKVARFVNSFFTINKRYGVV